VAKNISLVVLTLTFCIGFSDQGRGEFSEFRSIFVDRFDYSYNTGNIPAMTSAIQNQIQKAADEGFSHVIWQVRGRGDALYNSNYEPPVIGLTPGFDPLQVALDAAHDNGIKLNAWINSTNLWQANIGAPPAGHIYHNTNPSFRLMDSNGNYEPYSGWSNYSSVNPILPDVHNHINNVVNDIATNYEVDGIHLDYIRYIPGGYNFDRLPHDPLSHQMFQQATGLDASNPGNFSAYKNYVKTRITDLVASIKQTVDTAEGNLGRPIDLTASVWRDPDVGENDYMQDYGTWIEQELLDVAMPMIYLRESNDYLFNPNLRNSLTIKHNSGSSTLVAPTLATYLHVQSGNGGIDLSMSQIERAYSFGADGVGFYDFPHYFNSQTANEKQAILDYLDLVGQKPNGGSPGNVIDDFEVDEGHFHWPWDHSPSSQTFGLSAGTSIQQVSTEAQAGTGALELSLDDGPGDDWQLRLNTGTDIAGLPAYNTPFPSTGYVGFWLKTSDPTLSVQISIDDPGTSELDVETLGGSRIEAVDPIGLDLGGRAQESRDGALTQIVFFGFFLGQFPELDQNVRQGVVVSQRNDLAVPDQDDSRITDMADSDSVAGDHHAAERSSAPVESRLEFAFEGQSLPDHLRDGASEFDRPLGQTFGSIIRPPASECLARGLDRESTRMFAILDPTDTVGDAEEPEADFARATDSLKENVAAGILVVFSEEIIAHRRGRADLKTKGSIELDSQLLEPVEEFVGIRIRQLAVWRDAPCEYLR